MMLVPVFNTAGVQTGSVNFPAPWNYLMIDARIQGNQVWEQARIVTDAMTLGDLEKLMHNERQNWVHVIMESLENKLELEQPQWWKEVESPIERKGALAYFLSKLSPAWEVTSDEYRRTVLAVPTEHAGEVLGMYILRNHLLTSKMFEWNTYWRARR